MGALDVLLIEAENSSFLGFEVDMASQPERIASLETHRSWQWVAICFLFTVVGVWCGWLSTAVIDMHSDLRAIKQKISDGGNGAIVSALEHPSSPQQLAANLALVSSQVRVARAEGKKADPQKLANLSTAIETVAQRDPSVPEVWQAASEIVTYRSEQKFFANGEPPNCLDVWVQPASISLQNHTTTVLQPVILQNCKMVLDFDWDKDVKGTKPSGNVPLYPFLDLDYGEWRGGPAVIFKNAVIVYRGGPIQVHVPMAFQNCLFNLETKQDPTPNGRLLVRTLLASDLQNVVVPFATMDSKKSG
jgi:hypothetical protein